MDFKVSISPSTIKKALRWFRRKRADRLSEEVRKDLEITKPSPKGRENPYIKHIKEIGK